MKIIYVEDSPYKAKDVRKVVEEMGIKREDIIIRDDLNTGLLSVRETLEQGDTIPFLLTDMYYPIVKGDSINSDAGSMFIKRVKHRNPELPIIVISSENLFIPEADGFVWYHPEKLWENKLKDAIRGYLHG